MARIGGTTAGTGEFGPAVIFAALLAEGVRFHFVGFVTHYAAELCQARLPKGPDGTHHPRSHEDNVECLARTLVVLGASSRPADGRVKPFLGDAAVLAGVHQWFETPHGSVQVTVRDARGESPAAAGLDPLSAGVRICINTPVSVLRAHAATGQFPGLEQVVEIIELMDSTGDGNPP